MEVVDPGFPRWGANLRGEGSNLLFDTIFAENCMKMKKKIRLSGGAPIQIRQ